MFLVALVRFSTSFRRLHTDDQGPPPDPRRLGHRMSPNASGVPVAAIRTTAKQGKNPLFYF